MSIFFVKVKVYKHQYYPIPQQAIIYSTKNGTATLTQNPGY